MKNKDQVKGRMQKAVGDLTDNKDLQKQGAATERAGRAKDALQGAKDKGDRVIDNVKDKLSHH
jgi:uncharacterized protein YjbJ (UPF0337 family)